MKKIESFEEEFVAVQGLSLETSYATIKKEKGVKLCVSVGYRAEDDYGWFELYDEKTGGDDWYAEGGLWFNNEELTDYDGVFSLPPCISDYLKEKGFDVSYVED